MNLHEHKEEFEELIAIVADYIGVPADAVRRDYYIVQMMQNLQNSEYAEVCVFKGGTSLSKCYPGSINRFSEDIDLTFIPVEDMTNKKYSKALKRVEDTISAGFLMEKIEDERNDRNKSAFVWPENESKETSYRGSGRLIRRRSGWLTPARNCGVASLSAAHGGIRLGIPPRIRLCSLRGSRCPSLWGSLRCPPQSLRPPFFPFAPNAVPKPVPGCSETTCRRAYISESGPARQIS